MKILYMNQGGGGQWGAIKYAIYDLILLAESAIIKDGFDLVWTSKSKPKMSIQANKESGRSTINIQDLDNTAQTVRPIITFTTKDGIRVVFMHLKSGSERYATDALALAVEAWEEERQFKPEIPTLWIGDFNRALDDVLPEAQLIYAGGGQSHWDLDRAYITGDWSAFDIHASNPSTAGADHGHVAIEVEYTRKNSNIITETVFDQPEAISTPKESSVQNNMPELKKIGSFVDAGKSDLKNHVFVSNELNKLAMARSSNLVGAAAASGVGPEEDGEKPVWFRLNQTGNIFYSMTSETLQKETKDLFESVTVLFSAMTQALAQKGKDLFDYDAWSTLISKSGYFVEMQKFETILEIQNNSLTVDTQIVQQLLPALVSGNSLLIAKSILSAVNGKYQSQSENEETKIGHLLFICEELFGAPSVTVRLFYGTKTSHSNLTQSPCHQTTSVKIEQKQMANTFLFVSPDTISKFAGKFRESPQEYTDLIARLSSTLEPAKQE